MSFHVAVRRRPCASCPASPSRTPWPTATAGPTCCSDRSAGRWPATEETAGAMSVMTARRPGRAADPAAPSRAASTTTSSACAAPCRCGPTARAGSCIPATWPACRRASCTPTSSTATTASSWARSRRPAGIASSTSPARPYAGPAYPQVDPSPPPFAKFGAAEAKFAMKYFLDGALRRGEHRSRRRAARVTRARTSCAPARDPGTSSSARSPFSS